MRREGGFSCEFHRRKSKAGDKPQKRDEKNKKTGLNSQKSQGKKKS